jgi:sulfide:quinone oxidoreductase
MDIKTINDEFSVSGQILPDQMPAIAEAGYKSIICNRPDGESPDQPTIDEVEQAATAAGLQCRYLPVVAGKVSDFDISHFARELAELPGPVLAFCRTGNRSMTLWSLVEARRGQGVDGIIAHAKSAGFDMSGIAGKLAGEQLTGTNGGKTYDVLIVGGGAGGIAAASSLLARDRGLDIAIVDPAEVHYYQPGWTLVGAGVFDREHTVKTMASLIPEGVEWIKAAVMAFEPENDRLVLENCRRLAYRRLIVAPGIKLDWHGVEGLAETLGHNGVTSNYRFDLAPYTWELVQQLKGGRALFTQPPMPIKCAGAPQKAMYLSCDHWLRAGVLDSIDVHFHNAGAVLFGVKDYVPALMEYVERYNAKLNFNQRLVRIDGPARTAWFEVTDENGEVSELSSEFDMIHVSPPQCAPDFISASPLADDAGWVDVDQNTLRHNRFENIWALGDAMSAPNAKTAAAARMQAPVVANNLLEDMGRVSGIAHYNGYGSCPLTVERGKIVLAEFGYGGKLLPSFPSWLINGKRPSTLAWLLKEKILPPVYWKAMLKGREWMARPEKTLPTA